MKHPLKTLLAVCIVSTAVVAVLTLCLEGIVRVAKPDINYQDVELSLFKDSTYSASLGWRPGAEGIVYGKRVKFDSLGLRAISAPASTTKTWLLIGDSVAFGVGVDTDSIFIQLVQNGLRDVRILNATVIGYSVPNYVDIIGHFLDTDLPIDKVVLFYCLNDIYGYHSVRPAYTGIQRILSYLRRHSKLYLFIKNGLTDRSKAYFTYDYQFYTRNNPELLEYFSQLGELDSILKSRDISFEICVLPYEYQLRNADTDSLRRPQQLINQYCQKQEIMHFDLFRPFRDSLPKSKDGFLFGDPMHLSPEGHKLVAKEMLDRWNSLISQTE